MSRIVIAILIYHRNKPMDLTDIFVQLPHVRYSVRVQLVGCNISTARIAEERTREVMALTVLMQMHSCIRAAALFRVAGS
jgi:hypothetical protein